MNKSQNKHNTKLTSKGDEIFREFDYSGRQKMTEKSYGPNFGLQTLRHFFDSNTLKNFKFVGVNHTWRQRQEHGYQATRLNKCKRS